MNVIPFPLRSEPEPLAFAIGARVDLRVGALAAGVVRPREMAEEEFSFSNLARLLRGARMAWRERGDHAPLTLVVPAHLYSSLDPDLLSEAAIEAGCTRQKLSFELDEHAIIRSGVGFAEELRARGWGIALRGDPACPLPLATRARSLYTEIVLEAPEDPDPYLALDSRDRSPLGRRLLAAKAAGIIVTAEAVRTRTQASVLAIAGFDRGGGAFAETRLRNRHPD